MYEEADLYSEVERLLPAKRVAFAAACAEWLYPSYEKYQAETGQRDGTAIRSALDGVWLAATGDEVGQAELQRLASQAEATVPTDKGHWSSLLPLAQNAAAAAVYATRVAHSPEPQEVVWTARQIIEAGDWLAQMGAPVQTYVIKSADLSDPGHVASQAVAGLLKAATTSALIPLRSRAESGGRAFCSLALGC